MTCQYNYLDQFFITLPSFVSNTCQMWISFFTIFTNNYTVIKLVLPTKQKQKQKQKWWYDSLIKYLAYSK